MSLGHSFKNKNFGKIRFFGAKNRNDRKFKIFKKINHWGRELENLHRGVTSQKVLRKNISLMSKVITDFLEFFFKFFICFDFFAPLVYPPPL
jgi:hypothetical protein